MQFCVGCGGALNLFETNDEGLCPSCWRKKELPSPPPGPMPLPTDLENACLCHEGNTLTLLSPEGWKLWSGPDNAPVRLGEVIEKARRIYTIRRKRVKN